MRSPFLPTQTILWFCDMIVTCLHVQTSAHLETPKLIFMCRMGLVHKWQHLIWDMCKAGRQMLRRGQETPKLQTSTKNSKAKSLQCPHCKEGCCRPFWWRATSQMGLCQSFNKEVVVPEDAPSSTHRLCLYWALSRSGFFCREGWHILQCYVTGEQGRGKYVLPVMWAWGQLWKMIVSKQVFVSVDLSCEEVTWPPDFSH